MRALLLFAIALPALAVAQQQQTAYAAPAAACPAGYTPAVRTVEVLECVAKDSIRCCDSGNAASSDSDSQSSSANKAGSARDVEGASNSTGTGNAGGDTGSNIDGGSSGSTSQSDPTDAEYCPEGPVPTFTAGRSYTLQLAPAGNRWAFKFARETRARTGVPSAAQRQNVESACKFRIESVPNKKCRFVMYSLHGAPSPAYLSYSGDAAGGRSVSASWGADRQGATEVYIMQLGGGQYRVTTGPAFDGEWPRLGLGSGDDLRFSSADKETAWKIEPTT
ncbi:unnamed protein product [Peniophora sp. CBMAI 1063]|nr:unnamed protein product [Peniophora sp. CBMAI 1063]